MIDFMVQIEGQNMIQVRYKSGVNRFVSLEEYEQNRRF